MRHLRTLQVFLWLTICQTLALADVGRLYTSDRLSSTLINCIMQDHEGYLWIGTDYGLNRFDGYHFTTYLNHAGDPRSLSHNNVQTLYTDSDGQLWVGTVKGLARYCAATDDFDQIDMRPGTD